MNNLNSENLTIRRFAGEEYLNMTNAAAFVGYSGTGFRNLLKRLKGTENEIPQYEFPEGRDKYVKKSDLVKYFSPRQVKD